MLLCLSSLSFSNVFSAQKDNDTWTTYLLKNGAKLAGEVLEQTAKAAQSIAAERKREAERNQKKELELIKAVRLAQEAVKQLEKNPEARAEIPNPKNDQWNWYGKKYANNINQAKDNLHRCKFELEKFKKNTLEEKEFSEKMMNGAIKFTNIAAEELQAELGAKRKLDQIKTKTAIEQQGRVKAATAKVEAWINFIRENPWLIVGSGVAAFTLGYSAYKSIGIASNQLEKWLGTPELVQETSYRSIIDKIKGSQKKDPIELDDVILEPPLKKKLNNFAQDIKEAHLFGRSLSNILFYGPPGTGKTLFSKALAYSSGLDYALISGSSFFQYSPGEAIIQMRKVFSWARTRKKGCVVIFDEPEVVLCDRSKATVEQKKIVNEFLAAIPKTIDEKMMVVLITNDPGSLDPAVLSRMGLSIRVPKPKKQELVKLMGSYENKARALGVAFEEGIERSYLETARLAEEAGLVGRSIENIFLFRLPNEVSRTDDLLATGTIIREIIQDYIEEEKQADEHVFGQG